MKNLQQIFSAVVILSVVLLTLNHSQPTQSGYAPIDPKKFEPSSGIQGAVEQVYSRRANQFTGEVDVEDVIRAWRQADALSANKKESGMQLYWDELGPDNVGGRTRAFLIDKNNPNRLYAGGVSGGLWFSNDAGVTWNKYNDLIESLAVASLCQAANGDIYFGTGEGLYGNWGNGAGGIQGQGIWKSTDGGVSFQRLPFTWDSASTAEKGAYVNVNRLAADPVNPNRIFAATKKGLRVTNDGGSSWVNPVKLVNGQPNQNICTDVEFTSDGKVICSLGNRLYKSWTGDTSSFTQVLNGLPSTSGRVEFAAAPSNPAYMYCAAAATTGLLLNNYISTDTGNTWTVIGAGTDPRFATFYGSNGQGVYNNTVAVDPSDHKTVLFGGLDIWKLTDTAWTKQSYSRSDSVPRYVHSDNHFIQFHSSDPNKVYISNDGGIYFSGDKGSTFDTSNQGFSVTQYYSVAASLSGEVIGGTQDNGTQYIDFKGTTIRSAKNINGGDGAFTEISRIDTNAFFASRQLGNLVRSASKGAKGTFVKFFDNHVAPDTSLVGKSYSFAHFVAPFLLWEKMNGTAPVDTSFVLGLVGSVWVTKKALDFSGTPKWYKVANVSGTPQTMAITDDGNTLFVGNSNGNLYRITGLNAVRDSIDTSGTGYDLSSLMSIKTLRTSSQTVTGIAVNQNNYNHLVVTYGNYGNTNFVYQSLNAVDSTPTFVSIQKNLPLMPVYGAVIDRLDSAGSRILLATELGIFMSEDKGSTWTEQNSGMARVPTFMIRQQDMETPGGKVWKIYIGTHGRGIFRSSTYVGVEERNVAIKKSSTLQVYPNPVRDFGYFSVQLQAPSSVSVDVYNLQGKKVRTEELGNFSTGIHRLKFEAAELNSGTYFVVVRTVNGVLSGKMMVVK